MEQWMCSGAAPELPSSGLVIVLRLKAPGFDKMLPQ